MPDTVVGDRTKVFQVLNNLIDNALKFTESGRVHLDVFPVDADSEVPCYDVLFSVADTGIGIREEDQASVFESFSQVDGSSTRRHQGTGLGLAVCKELTELMGGTVTVHSELDVGSTFAVRLPLTPPNLSPLRRSLDPVLRTWPLKAAHRHQVSGHRVGPLDEQITWRPKATRTGLVELRGLEPLTLCMPCRCATSCATAPGVARGWKPRGQLAES